MRKRLIALMLMAVFAFEQTNVLTAFAEEYDYMPIYDKDGNTVNVEDALSSRDAGNYVTIFDSEGNEVNIDDVVAEAEDRNKTDGSSSSSDNIYDNANSSGEYTPIYDELGNEVNPVDVLASEKTGINIPIYDDNGNTINPIDLEGKLYNLYGSEFRYIKVYDEAGNEIDWCGLLNNVEEWNARGFYTVTYVDSFDNSVIDTIVVPKGTSVTQIPTPPVHENYTFLSWIGNSNNVQKNETVTAVYLESTPKLDVFGYANGIEDYIEFYVYGTRTDYDGVLTSDLSQVNLKLSDYTWTDDEGRVFTPNEEGKFVDPRNGNTFTVYSESEVPDLTINASVVVENDKGNTIVTDDELAKKAKLAAIKASKKAVTDIMKHFVQTLTKEFGISQLSGAFNSFINGILGLDSENDAISKLSDQVNEVDTHLMKAESNIMEHSINVAEFEAQAQELQDLYKKSASLEEAIYNIEYKYEKGSFDASERDKRLAALYDLSVYKDVTGSLESAQSVFEFGNSLSVTGKTIYQSAYYTQCSRVMFSKEAKEAIKPYLMRQVNIYLKAYGLQNMVLDACEKTCGPDSVAYSREKMFRNLGGISNGVFDEKKPGIVGYLNKFYENTSDFIFVNKTADPSRHVALKQELLITPINGYIRITWGWKYIFPKEITNYTLNKDQVKSLADYCKNKNKSILDFLTNDIGFTCGKGVDSLSNSIIDATVNLLSSKNGVNYTRQDFIDAIYKGDCYLLADELKDLPGLTGKELYLNAVDANKKGADCEKLLIAHHNNTKRDDLMMNVLIFQTQ